jgi:hypothetical protein
MLLMLLMLGAQFLCSSLFRITFRALFGSEEERVEKNYTSV